MTSLLVIYKKRKNALC